MSKKIVVNTGPLISLAAGDAVHLLRDLPQQFLVPRDVQQELERGECYGHPGVDLSSVTIIEVDEPVDAVTLSVLDRGEAAVIQLALRHEIGTVCIDEKKGRRIARAVDLEVVGTLGLLLEGKRRGVLAAVAPVIENLLGFGVWYDTGLLEHVLSAAGETCPMVTKWPPKGGWGTERS